MTDPDYPVWKRRSWNDILDLGQQCGLNETVLKELEQALIYDNMAALSYESYLILDTNELIGPSGAFMADCFSLFYTQE